MKVCGVSLYKNLISGSTVILCSKHVIVVMNFAMINLIIMHFGICAIKICLLLLCSLNTL